MASLLFVPVWGIELRDALEQARDALQQAERARPVARKVLLQRAQRALATLPAEAREPLKELITQAEASGDRETLARARASVQAYLETLSDPPAPLPAPDAVKAQLETIFAEPDMQIPPKSLSERLGEAFLNALEGFVRWLNRMLGGLGGVPVGGIQPFLQWLVIVLLALTIGLAVAYLLGHVRFQRRTRTALPALQNAFQDARAMSASEWHALARELASQQHWRLALRACYLGLLRLLHEAHLLDYDPALTNWEHLQRLRRPLPLPRPAFSPAPPSDAAVREEAYQLLRPLTVQFDTVWYGGVAPDESHYRQFEAAFETLHGRLRTYGVSA
ncbi:MAG: DUF4129 domain-containing protein [Fimbriimonadales bacterium]|nr:DUF4129 domain-containing protein [Fimbriimonadales bacterium]